MNTDSPAPSADSPRTDAMRESLGIHCHCSDKPIELCYELESELSAANAAHDEETYKSNVAIQALEQGLAEARMEVARLERDRERLNRPCDAGDGYAGCQIVNNECVQCGRRYPIKSALSVSEMLRGWADGWEVPEQFRQMPFLQMVALAEYIDNRSAIDVAADAAKDQA